MNSAFYGEGNHTPVLFAVAKIIIGVALFMGENGLKVLLTGDSGVGKSSILVRFTDDHFDADLPSTIGVDFKVKILSIRGQKVRLNVWDTAGQERFRTLTSSYYRGAQGVILVYDISNEQSFANIETWLKEVVQYSTKGKPVMLLIGNKLDRADKREVSKDRGLALAQQHGMMFMECSAKSNVGIQRAFEELSEKIIERQPSSGSSSAGLNLGSNNDSESYLGCGC